MKNSIALALLLCIFCISSSRAQKPATEPFIKAGRQTATTNSRVASSQSITTIPFELYDNLIYLTVRVNGSKPLWFILDSGASGCVIDQTQAKLLGLKTEGKAKGTGAGAGTYDLTFAKNVTFKLSVIETQIESSYVIDLSSNLSVEGREAHGILGYDFFNRYVVLIDYDAMILRLYDPRTYNYSGRGEIIPFTFKRKLPHVTAKFKVAGHEPADRDFLIDTGSADAVDDDLIAQASSPKLETVGGVGLGQEFKTVLGRAEWLKLGSFTIDNTLGVSGGTALIGGEVLHRFTVIFDYSRHQMILEPNRHFRDEFVYGASGADLRLVPESKIFRVHSVRKDSPAAEAGLREGDLIMAIDGSPTAEFNLDQAQRMFAQDGSEYLLSAKRGSEPLQAKIKLRKLL
jgi:hypothetical protein